MSELTPAERIDAALARIETAMSARAAAAEKLGKGIEEGAEGARGRGWARMRQVMRQMMETLALGASPPPGVVGEAGR